MRLSGPDIARAERQRTALYQRMREFMETYEFLICPVSQTPPFDVTQPYLTAINGVPMETYIDWMRSCYYITMTTLPAISVPAGFAPDGLPVGLQIVGRHHDDWGVLELAHSFEQAHDFHRRCPSIAAAPMQL
jgi:amidase